VLPLGQVKTTVRTEETLLTKNKKSASSNRKRSDQPNADTKRRKGKSVEVREPPDVHSVEFEAFMEIECNSFPRN
jgi:hypothetical protein